jgi:hypothetical protein
LSGVVIAAGTAGVVCAAAKPGSASMAKAVTAARVLMRCFIVSSPLFDDRIVFEREAIPAM